MTTLSKPGTLIHARGREWVILPESTDDLLIARPVGGLDEEITGILPAAEKVESASFLLPTQNDLGDFTSGKLLREAARLSTRAAAGPFRSFGRIAIEPRPYQLVPLMMAMKLHPIRLLIADDVGIGKTIEAALIARELIDRGEIDRFSVLCPPHLAEQWHQELSEKFHIDAELILSNTIQRLERNLPVGVSVFDRHPFTIVSTDFIKTPRRAEDFIIKCPELVIVDEAHGCTLSGGVGRGQQQRFDLLQRIAKDNERHIVLVTATPHSGNEDAFRSLLSLLDPEFSNLPVDLDGAEREGIRRKLAKHLVQRRRADIRRYLETETTFPERYDSDITYEFSQGYKSLFNDIWNFAREYVSTAEGGRREKRVRYWSALALLRCVSSSPAAAAATLKSRAKVDQAEESEVDEIGRGTVLDHDDADDIVSLDFSPGSNTENCQDATRRKLREFARRAEELPPEADLKFQNIVKEIKSLINKKFYPIIFCRFVDTAEYLARLLRDVLPHKVKIESITGLLPPSEREARIESLASEGDQYVLVCTDCLSEGINLQQHFNAVLHYDLAWNPTRHEQREGRVDRFGQEKKEVRVLTYFGSNNPIDGVILDVLIRKHKSIKSDLGVTVAVPGSSEKIAEALFEGALFREQTGTDSQQMALDFLDSIEPHKEEIHVEWENAREREKVSRSRFAQHTLSPEAVSKELKNVRDAIGRKEEVEYFFNTTMQRARIPVTPQDKSLTVHISSETPRSLRQNLGHEKEFSGSFDLPLKKRQVYLGRTSPVIEALACWTLDNSLDPKGRENRLSVAARCGAIFTSAVCERTNLLIVRFRYHLKTTKGNNGATLCEEVLPLACIGRPEAPQWLTNEKAEHLLSVQPEGNMISTGMDQQLSLLLPSLPALQKSLEPVAKDRAEVQLKTHNRVRESTRMRGRVSIDPVFPVDIVGAYILLKKPA